MNSNNIRKNFINFFIKKGHHQVAAAPIVNKQDPSLLFTNAGMNQFKDLFIDHHRALYTRVTSAQPCLRVSGKHNDLEEVGTDTYHHTLFEMLGNWSFGEYFKKEAIQWAWELLTEVYHLPKERLYITVFGGDPGEQLAVDQEALEIWKNYVPEAHILYGSKAENFWEMGDTGPCGPSTEIHIDIRDEAAIAAQSGKALVNTGHPQVIEIWNLVFIQYNRLANGKLEELAAKHVDTGLGLERLAMVLQGKQSTYDTDIFAALLQAISQASGKSYGQGLATDIAMRVIVDHLRAVTFAIADGQLPSNNQAGYVVRRLLRRAVRYGYTYLGFTKPFIYKLVAFLAKQMGEIYPVLAKQQAYISQVICGEEESFFRTLATGLQRLEQVSKNLQEKDQLTIPGDIAFELYDTYGFPLDLTCLIAKNQGLQVDEIGFQKALEAQRLRSQKAAAIVQGDWQVIHKDVQPNFVGYDCLSTEAKIISYRKIEEKSQALYQLILDQTPFYPEGGGQIGDTGMLSNAEENLVVINTKKENGLITHYVQSLPSNLDKPFHAVVDVHRRNLIANNHSATHLLHAALKHVLGPHVAQRGSLVTDQLLRFDFSHYSKLDADTIRQVEDLVNQKIRTNITLQEQRQVPLATAKTMGAIAHFGEKYSDYVRIITFDTDFSKELCGGTHVGATGQIGFFKIIAESAVAAGIRRIEAVTADAFDDFLHKQLDTIDQLKIGLKSPKDLVKAVDQLVEANATLSKQVVEYQVKQVQKVHENLKKEIQTIHGVYSLIERVEVPYTEALKQLALDLKMQYQPIFLVLGTVIDAKPYIAVLISEEVMHSCGLNARQVVQELAKPIQGGGGGQAFFATAGGKNAAGLDKALHIARAIALEKQLVIKDF